MLTQEHDTRVTQVPSFEQEYLGVRAVEKRLYSDETVRTLPAIAPDHEHASEWELRSRSASRLTKYLLTKPPGQLLEIGCGNGWFSNLIATLTPHSIVATDVNAFELEQGKRLFQRNNLQFVLADKNEIFPEKQSFDFILFAASIQYFPSLPSILNSCIDRLSSRGEIHILDTRFYKQSEIAEARERTRLYYLSLGYPRMSSNYFHHSWQDLQPFRPQILFNPFSIINRLTGSDHEFPWIRIRKSRQQH